MKLLTGTFTRTLTNIFPEQLFLFACLLESVHQKGETSYLFSLATSHNQCYGGGLNS